MKRILILLLCLAQCLSLPPVLAEPPSSAAWITYWDADNGVREAALHEKRFDALVYFAAYFDTDDALYYPPELEEMQAQLKTLLPQASQHGYLSIVNDYTVAPERYELKSQPLLKRLLQSGAQRRIQLANDIVKTTLDLGYQGIEIDFEGILNNLPLWEDFFAFLIDLHEKAKAQGLPLRVLLEPRTPMAQLSFPEGPRYIMMCYNLYGYHSGPGPKANSEFLKSMVSKMSVLPQASRGFALALGGFDWSQGKVSQLTMQAAQRMLKASGAQLHRQEEAAHFSYRDETGHLHEVWYADEVTLAYWTGVLTGLGEKHIDYWKLGENLNESL